VHARRDFHRQSRRFVIGQKLEHIRIVHIVADYDSIRTVSSTTGPKFRQWPKPAQAWQRGFRFRDGADNNHPQHGIRLIVSVLVDRCFGFTGWCIVVS
jgi:hypothetical protein